VQCPVAPACAGIGRVHGTVGCRAVAGGDTAVATARWRLAARRGAVALAAAPAPELDAAPAALRAPRARPDAAVLRRADEAALRRARDARAPLVDGAILVVVDAVAAELALGATGRGRVRAVR